MTSLRASRALLSPVPGTEVRRLAIFAVVGVACTVAYGLIFAALVARALHPLPANAVALTSTMALNFWLNRWLTFAGTARRLVPEAFRYAAAYAAGVLASTAALQTLLVIAHTGSLAGTTAAGMVAGLVATAVRYLLLRNWVFAPSRQVA